MNDKQQLAVMGEHMSEQAAQPLRMAKRIEEMEAQVRVMAGLLRRARRYVSPLSCHESEIQIVQSIVSSIDSVLAGNLPERKITKPARVWGARFMPGIPEQTIIEAAYRYAEHESSQEEKEAGKINFDLLMAAVHKIAPEGWQLVPVEPTENMIGHGCGASVMVVSEVIKAWAAMLAAAPKPEAK